MAAMLLFTLIIAGILVLLLAKAGSLMGCAANRYQ
jgi:hypothetical protein